jgi:hypothetical protein
MGREIDGPLIQTKTFLHISVANTASLANVAKFKFGRTVKNKIALMKK